MYAINPSAIPFAIEKVSGIITIIINAGKSSVMSDQLSFSIPLSINIATYINAPAVAKVGIIDANGEKKIEIRKKMPTITAVKPVLPPASTPAELST